MWLPIHAEIKVKPCYLKGAQYIKDTSHERYGVSNHIYGLFVQQLDQTNTKQTPKINNTRPLTPDPLMYNQWCRKLSTEALKGHRVLWKIEICYLIRMT